MSKNEIVNLEVAASEFERFCDAMDIDVDENFMDEDEINSFKRMKDRLIKSIMVGRLTIDADTGEAIYTPKSGNFEEPIRFKERTGATITAADTKKKNQSGAKMYAMMATMAGVAPNQLVKMKGIDIKVCEAIFTLLMD